MKIQIKRACDDGLRESTADLFLYGEFQFCLINAEGWYMLIELSTGAAVHKQLDDDFYSKKEAKAVFKEMLSSKTDDEIKNAIAEFKGKYKDISYPVNEPVKIK